MARADVIVVGLGAMGSAAVHHLASRGASVIGIDQHRPPHSMGSSHGDTRITRLAVGEGDQYVPLVRRSHELWERLEAASKRTLRVQCGGIVMGVASQRGMHGVGDFTEATIEVARRNGIAHEVLSSDQVRERFPAFAVTEERGCYEPTAGYLRAADCIAAHLEVAGRSGADLRYGETASAWSASARGVEVVTSAGRHHAARLVLTAGPWLPRLAPELAHLFVVERQLMAWFDVGASYDSVARLPVWIWHHGAGVDDVAYGFPAIDGPGGGAKCASEAFGSPTSPETVERTASAAEVAALYGEHVGGRVLGLGRAAVRAETCLYTVTPDFGFVIDRHPGHPNVLIASPCSGHGFKHSAAVGECVAALATDNTPVVDIAAFGLSRFD